MKSILPLLVFGALCVISSGQVLGIDFGSEFWKASLISPGKSFVIIENLTSQRKTENAISFYNKERIYEDDAVQKRTKNPRNSFVFLNKFLGALANDQEIIKISKQNYEDFLIEVDQQRGTFAFKIDNFKLEGEVGEDLIDDQKSQDEDIVLRVEQLVGMILKYITKLVLKQFSVQVRDCVITVPSSWTLNQRSALKSAVKIAGLDVLAFQNENSAVALYYAIERLDNTTHTVLFYNLGAYNLQVTLAEFLAVNDTKTKKHQESVRILADYSVPNIGGNRYDLALAHHFAEAFDALPQRKGKKSINEIPKNFLKLLKASNKYKEILSANKEAHVYIEGLADNIDFHTTVLRTTFEELCKQELAQLIWPIEKVLQIANRTKEDISIVELIGGGVRVPKVQQTLQEFFGETVEVGAHLNGDETMAKGAAFLAATISPLFKVRPIQYSWIQF